MELHEGDIILLKENVQIDFFVPQHFISPQSECGNFGLIETTIIIGKTDIGFNLDFLKGKWLVTRIEEETVDGGSVGLGNAERVYCEKTDNHDIKGRFYATICYGAAGAHNKDGENIEVVGKAEIKWVIKEDLER